MRRWHNIFAMALTGCWSWLYDSEGAQGYWLTWACTPQHFTKLQDGPKGSEWEECMYMGCESSEINFKREIQRLGLFYLMFIINTGFYFWLFNFIRLFSSFEKWVRGEVDHWWSHVYIREVWQGPGDGFGTSVSVKNIFFAQKYSDTFTTPTHSFTTVTSETQCIARFYYKLVPM